MIYVTGDTHIPIDIHKLNTLSFPEQKSMTKEDYVIVCGDFGLLFNYRETGVSVPACPEDICWDREEKFWYDWLNEKPFTTLWVDGNHENYDRLKKYPVTEWHGGKVQKISDSIIHLMRGQVYEIDGLTVFTLGGAQSIDRGSFTGTEKRDAHMIWWKEELPSKKEYTEAERNLGAHGNKVDYIFTHEAPGNVLMNINIPQNDLSGHLWQIYDTTDFKAWYCGHHHRDDRFGKVRIIYNDIERLD